MALFSPYCPLEHAEIRNMSIFGLPLPGRGKSSVARELKKASLHE
jgi:hypothetical protein